jgi:succinyl-CoA synthetase beta subunit
VKVAQISWDAATNSITPDTKLPGWVFNTKLVAKPDQLIKRRGKAGLLALNKTWDEAKPWIAERAGKPQKVGLVPFFLAPDGAYIQLMENVFVIHLSDLIGGRVL